MNEKTRANIISVLENAIGRKYASAILRQVDEFTGNSFIDEVLLSLSYSDFCDIADIKKAIGAELIARLGAEV